MDNDAMMVSGGAILKEIYFSRCPMIDTRISQIEGTDNTPSSTIKDMGVNHSSFDIAVTEEFLDGADVVAVS